MASKYDDDDPGYADSKYGDDGGGESKYGGGGAAPAEAKSSGGGGKSSYEVGVVLPPIVQAFAHHVMSKKYRDAVEAFFAAKCGPFKGVDPTAEQRLEYTDVYQSYVGVVEVQLEAFCAAKGVTPEELFAEVQDLMRGGDLDDEFLPAILRVAEYSYFMEQLVGHADHPSLLAQALDTQKAQAAAQAGLHGSTGAQDAKSSAGEVVDPLSVTSESVLSGVWRVDKKRTNFEALDLYLAAIRVPAVFRGLAKGTFFSNKEVVVLQTSSRIAVVANSPFGMQRLDYLLDDKTHQVANPWGAEVPVRAALDPRGRDGVEVVIEQSKPKHLPAGSAVVHTWCGVDNGNALRCTMEVREPGRSSVSFEMFYAPVTAKDLAPKTKGPSNQPSKKGGGAEAKGEGSSSAAESK